MSRASMHFGAIALAIGSFALIATSTPSAVVHAQPSSSANETSLVLHPSDAHGNPVGSLGYFAVTAAAGTATHLEAFVGNTGHKHLVARVAPVDAVSGVFGGVSYKLPWQKRQQVGRWIELPWSKAKLAPRKGSLLPFVVRVPRGTAPGQYVGAITAYIPASTPRKQGRHAAIILQFRLVDAVVVTVPGPAYARFHVTRVSLQHRPNGIYAVTHIRNTGTTLAKSQGYLRVWRPGWHKPQLTRLAIDTMVPHTAVNYPVTLRGHVYPGWYGFAVTVRWHGGQTTWRGHTLIKK